MDYEGQQPRELKELERELRALVPRGPKVDLARIMFMAGQASMSPIPPPAPPAVPWGAWYWPISTAIASVVAVWLGVMLIWTQTHPTLVPAPQHAVAPHPPLENPQAAPRAEDSASPDAPLSAIAEYSPGVGVSESLVEDARYVRDRQTALSQGIDALPQPAQSGARSTSPETYGALTRDVIREQQRRTIRGDTTSLWDLW
jgi:hypothetical protein